MDSSGGFSIKARRAFTTKNGFLKMIQTKETENMKKNEANGQGTWSNIDLDPTPPRQRNWSAWYFFAFQFSISFSPTTYNVGASLIAVGLSWWIILVASVVGSILCSLVLFFNSWGASNYHVGFPVFARISAGFYGSLFFIFVRCIVAILYMATQSYYASSLLAVSFRCIFGSKWTDITNHLPASAGITSSGLLAFFIFWLLQLPFAWLHPSRVAPVFAIKSIIVPPVVIATMIWAVVIAKGPHFQNLGAQNASGPALGWLFMKALNTTISNVIPPLINIPDLARYANRPRDTWPMVAGLLFSKPLVIFLGIITTSAGVELFGKAFWNQWDFYNAVLDNYWGPGTRTAVCLAALSQAFATLATNISSNSIPVGCDLTGLFPNYFTIVRGQVLCSILAICCVPWLMVNTAASFLTFLGTYVCFICPIVACMMVDYWIARKGNIHIPSLYSADASSPYYYTKGINFRAYVAWAVGVVLVISGIAGVLKPGSIGIEAVNIYNMSFILSTTSASLAYLLIVKIWPIKVFPPGPHENDPVMWEAMVPTEGFFEEDDMPEYLRQGSERVRTCEPEAQGVFFPSKRD